MAGEGVQKEGWLPDSPDPSPFGEFTRNGTEAKTQSGRLEQGEGAVCPSLRVRDVTPPPIEGPKHHQEPLCSTDPMSTLTSDPWNSFCLFQSMY